MELQSAINLHTGIADCNIVAWCNCKDYLISMVNVFDSSKRKIELLKLVADGVEYYDAIEMMGLNINTVNSWLSRDPDFKDRLARVKKVEGRRLIEKNLKKLADGVKTKEHRNKYVVTKVIDGKETPVEVTETETQHAPNEKALNRLAQVYCPEYVEKQTTYNEATVSVKITSEHRALSVEDRKKIIELDSSDYTIDEELKALGIVD